MRKSDIAARIGGEEFAVLLIDSNPESNKHFMLRLQQNIAAQAVEVGEESIRYTISVGMTLLSLDDETATDAFSRADQVLYRAKNRGRDRIEIC